MVHRTEYGHAPSRALLKTDGELHFLDIHHLLVQVPLSAILTD